MSRIPRRPHHKSQIESWVLLTGDVDGRLSCAIIKRRHAFVCHQPDDGPVEIDGAGVVLVSPERRRRRFRLAAVAAFPTQRRPQIR
jgi:hypothetical protein